MKLTAKRIMALAAFAMLGDLAFGVVPGGASPARDERVVAAPEISAQTRVRPRARTQIRVYPRYPVRRTTTVDVVLPYGIDSPGPNAVRHCNSRLVQEHRPSGTVIVPRTQCWWARR
jgi:hypothetical protein